MSWYEQGVISLTNGSKTVTAVGASWLANVNPASAIQLASGGRLLQIESITNDNALQLAKPYAGATVSGVAYEIIPTQGLVPPLTKKVGALLSTIGQMKDAYEAGDFADQMDLAGTAKKADLTVLSNTLKDEFSEPTGAAMVGGGAITVPSIKQLFSVPRTMRQSYRVLAFHEHTSVFNVIKPEALDAASDYIWLDSVPAGLHDGGSIIAFSKAADFPADWSNEAQKALWFTPPVGGTGCFVIYNTIEGVPLTVWGARGRGADDTKSILAAVKACKNLALTESPTLRKKCTGTPLIIPLVDGGRFVCNSEVLIDRPIIIRGQGNGRGIVNLLAPQIYFPNSNGFVFTDAAAFYVLSDFRIEGTKAGGINVDPPNPADRVFGNVGLKFQNELARGRVDFVQVTGFDIGKLGASTNPVGAMKSWAGAYKYFNYCAFLNNTYSICNLDFVTDETYLECSTRADGFFGGVDPKVGGYIYLSCRNKTEEYQSINLIGCMLENIGKKDGTYAFDSRGIIVKGRSHVFITGGYVEATQMFIDSGASLVAKGAFITCQIGTRIGGGGVFDIGGCYARSTVVPHAAFTDAYWLKSNLTAAGKSLYQGYHADVFTVTAVPALPNTPYIGSNNITVDREASAAAFTNAVNEFEILCEIEYYAPAGVTLVIKASIYNTAGATASQNPNNIASPAYYSGTAGWRRMAYTLNHQGVLNGAQVSTISPLITVEGASVGTVFAIRSHSFTVLAR